MGALRDHLRAWLGVSAPFPESIFGNVRIEAPISPEAEPLRITVRGPHRDTLLVAYGHIHAVSFEGDKPEIHVVADRVELVKGGRR